MYKPIISSCIVGRMTLINRIRLGIVKQELVIKFFKPTHLSLNNKAHIFRLYFFWIWRCKIISIRPTDVERGWDNPRTAFYGKFLVPPSSPSTRGFNPSSQPGYSTRWLNPGIQPSCFLAPSSGQYNKYAYKL